MNKKHALIIAAVLTTIIGVLRALGGIALFIKGNALDTEIPVVASESQMYSVTIGLLVIGVLFVIASVNLIRNYSKKSWVISWIILFLFIVGGLINGFVLFGHPIDQGQKINIIVVIIIGLFLMLGKSALRTTKQK